MTAPDSPILPIEPEGWVRGRGYSHGTFAVDGGAILFVAGQIGWNERQQLVADDFAAQFGQALENVATVVGAAGGEPGHIGRLVIYVVDRHEYLSSAKALAAAYRRVMGRHYPAMTLVEVQALLEPGAKVEIEATAVLPPRPEGRS